MNLERVARILLGAAALCCLFVSAGCNGALSGDNSMNSGGTSGVTPIASVQGQGDWGMRLLAGGTAGVGMFPAKFTFDVTADPDCAKDYVAFNSSQPGVFPTTPSTQATPNTFGASGIPAGTITITQQAASLVLTASGSNTAPTPAHAAGSTSGIVVDNAGTAIGAGAPFVQASSIYFTLGTNSTGTGPGVPSCNTTAGVGCAVKLTQSGLN